MLPSRGKYMDKQHTEKKKNKTTPKSKKEPFRSPCDAWRAHPDPGIRVAGQGAAAPWDGCTPRHGGAGSCVPTIRQGSPQPPLLPFTHGTKPTSPSSPEKTSPGCPNTVQGHRAGPQRREKAGKGTARENKKTQFSAQATI